MRLALKLALAFTLANVALAAVYGYLAMRRDAYLFQRQLDEEAQELGPVMECLLTDAWKSNGDRGMRESLKRFCSGQEQPVRVRWVWFDSTDEDSRPAAPGNRRSSQRAWRTRSDGPDGTSYLVIYWPVKLSTERQGGLEFAHPTDRIDCPTSGKSCCGLPCSSAAWRCSAAFWPCCWASVSSAGRWST